MLDDKDALAVLRFTASEFSLLLSSTSWEKKYATFQIETLCCVNNRSVCDDFCRSVLQRTERLSSFGILTKCNEAFRLEFTRPRRMACVEDATIDANEWACSELGPINYICSIAISFNTYSNCHVDGN